MPKLRVLCFAMSIDGYSAGPNQDLQNPLGVRGPKLMEWFIHTRLWRKILGNDDGETGETSLKTCRSASAPPSRGCALPPPSRTRSLDERFIPSTQL